MKIKTENLKLKVKFFAAAGMLAFMVFSTGCAGLAVNETRRFTEADYMKAEVSAFDSDWEPDFGYKSSEPVLGSNEWFIKYRAIFKVASVALWTGLALQGDSHSDKMVTVPICALVGYGLASMPVDWDKEGNWYKWPVVCGAIAGLTAGIVIIQQNKLYEGQYGWEGLVCFGTSLMATIVGTGVGGIIGDIANAIDMYEKKAKHEK